VIAIETVRPTTAFMESHLEATMNGSCAELQGRIIESFIRTIGNLMVLHDLCQPQHRCRIRNTFVYCTTNTKQLQGASTPLPKASDTFSVVENLTVDFVLEMELQSGSHPVTLSAQRALVHGLDDVFTVFYQLVSDGELTWSTLDSVIIAVSLDSALTQFDVDNCTAGQILNERNSDVPTCRKCFSSFLPDWH